ARERRLRAGASATEEAAERIEPLELRPAREAQIPGGDGKPAQARGVGGEGVLVSEEDPAPVGKGQRIPEGEPRHGFGVPPRRLCRLLEPAAELPAAARGHAVEEAPGSAPGPQDPLQHPAPAAEPGERRIDLREPGAPPGRRLLPERALEVVSGA